MSYYYSLWEQMVVTGKYIMVSSIHVYGERCAPIGAATMYSMQLQVLYSTLSSGEEVFHVPMITVSSPRLGRRLLQA